MTLSWNLQNKKEPSRQRGEGRALGAEGPDQGFGKRGDATEVDRAGHCRRIETLF